MHCLSTLGLSLASSTFQAATAAQAEGKSHELAAAVIGAVVGAVLGALLTGWVTYLATKALESNKQRELLLRLYSLLLLELAGHQAALALEVDTFLPAWLLRGEPSLAGGEWVVDLHFTRLGLRLNKLADEYYSRFFEEFLHADLIVELESYYRSVRSLNRLISEWDPKRATEKADSYVRKTLSVFSVGMDLFNKIQHSPGISKYFVSAQRSAISEFDAQEQRHRYLLVLSDLRIRALERLRRALEFENLEPEELRSVRKMGGSPPDVSEIPDLIKTDPNRLWEQYLDDATKINLRS
jgi:hypothetical protein